MTTQQIAARPEELGGFYVSCVDAGKVYLMSGPYSTHAQAIADVSEALKIADARDGRAWFMSWGTCRVREVELKPGVLNRLGLMEITSHAA